VADDPEKALRALRQQIAAEGLPKLSTEALRSTGRRRKYSLRPQLLPQKNEPNSIVLSEEARRLYHEKSDPDWPQRK
jgi:hypothetical protein